MSKRTKWVIGMAVVAAALVTAGYWWNEYRSESLLDAVNPAYWVSRLRGEDLYDYRTHLLKHGNRSLKEVALTIDDGPHSQTGDQLLNILRDNHVPATFFVVGRRMDERPDLVRRMLAEGHEVGNHSEDHYRLDTLNARQARRQINDCDISFNRITGCHFSLMRPPGVRYNDTVLHVADELGYVIVSWNCAAKDFEDVTPDFIVNRVSRRVENGSIILLHDDRPATVTALPRVIQSLKRDGYRFVTISEMLSHLPKPVIVAPARAAGQASTSASL